MNTVRVQWESGLVELTWIVSKELPPLDKVTSVHGCCFYNGMVLLVNIKGRGFNFPGGHIEQGESPEEAFAREAMEEGYVKGRAGQIGMIKVSHENNPGFDPKGKYPVVGYQLFYRMDIEEVLPFLRDNESTCRIWAEPREVPYVMDDHELAVEILQEAAEGELHSII
ncbi:NUDIX domain-containing protein [Bacillus sp. AK031]